MQTFEVKDHAPSLLPEGKTWKLAFSDEFDGTELDRTKWDYRLHMMQKRHPAWVDRGVHLDGEGNVVFTLLEDENGNPVSAQLQTGHNFMDAPWTGVPLSEEDDIHWPIGALKENLYTHTYGYYECRCRLQKKPGWWSAFWMQSPVIGATLDPAETGVEIDIMECFQPGKIVAHNIFCGGYGLDMQRLHVGGGVEVDPEEYHRFGVLWDKNGYTFYIDGKEDGHIDGNVSHHPEFILISTEANGYRYEDHQPTAEAKAAIGDTFVVDYVRVFDCVEEA